MGTWAAPLDSAWVTRGKAPDHALVARMMAKVKVSPTGCWEWTASRSNGYSVIGFNGGTRQAHRLSYEALVGPIPDGLHLDHLCRVRHCINPDHLEPVTQAENNRRAWATKTECPQGHPKIPENTYVRPSGARYCRVCARIRAREEKRRKRDGELSH